MFKDLNDFRDRVGHMLTSDFFKPEDKVPNYFRNIAGKEVDILHKWEQLGTDSGFLKQRNNICVDCYQKADSYLQKGFAKFDRTLDSRVELPKGFSKTISERSNNFENLKLKLRSRIQS